jgi:hypothetical protein
MPPTSVRAHLLAIAAFSASILLVACSKPPTPGASCKTKGEIQCIDKKTGAVCVNGKWESMACEGPTGCMSVAGSGSCTHSNYAVGEACLEEGKPECSGDHKSMMKCENSHWKLVNTCAGALGCVSNALGTKCDLGASTEGSPCTKQNEGNASCTPDAKSLLLCKGGKMIIGARCKGMHGCRQLGTKLDCDETIADLGDVCDSSEYEGKFACATDKKTRLVCKNDKFVKDRACKCSVLIDKVNCD